MKKILTEKELRNIVRSYVNEAMQYDKGSRQYFPNYTGNPHSDAGKFVDSGKGGFDYSRNDYKWTDPKKQERFNKLLNKYDYFGADSDVPDVMNQDDAYEYLEAHGADSAMEKINDMLGKKFENVVVDFFKKSIKNYPILEHPYYMEEFYDAMYDIFKSIRYKFD